MAACFVLPIADDLRSIKTADLNAALIHQSGGGTGFSFSAIRPKGDYVRSSGGIASGPVSFMSMIDASCGIIKQGGTRRGANMGILQVDHPDILDFIECKTEDGKISNFNISVGITDAFMQAVEFDEPYDLINPRNGEVTDTLNARDVWETLVHSAWLNGEPGLLFIDRGIAANPTPHIGIQNTTNPCVTGETLILVRDGYIPIKYMKDRTVDVWNGSGFDRTTVRQTGTTQTLYRIQFNDGSTLDCTPYHKFYTLDGKREAQQLSIGAKLEKFAYPVIEGGHSLDAKLAYTAGFYAGDGTYEKGRDRHTIYLYGEKT